MRKLHVLLIILAATVLAVLIQVVFGNFLSARLSTLPFLRNLDLFDPRAPIVVTNREEVRVSDSNDAIETANSVKSKLSTVVYYEGSGADARLIISGGALNWTADGYFITTAAALATAKKTYAVVLNSGEIFPIKTVYFDTASGLAVLATDARGLAAIEPADAKNLRPGEKMLMILNSLGANRSTFLESYIQKYALDVAGIVFDSDKVGRTISVQSVDGFVPGQAAITLNGRLAGLWDGTRVISVDAIRLFASNFFGNNLQVLRPQYGFTYRQLSASEARALQLQAGAQVIEVKAGSPAFLAGLQKGDIITAVKDQKIDDDNLAENYLAAATPGEAVPLTVMRDGESIVVQVTPAILEIAATF